MLMISPKEDRFTFEIAWTRGNDYPVEQDNEITKHLVVELPPRGAERKRVFAWAGALALESGFDPDEDWGQTELYVMLD